ncbi:conserved Plasmodium protein, unknown function [Plasmodium vivax]|uniref:Uncharacterized protein n=1 Tax=Plasmodium vivax TaxID=5855 RepID=A0A1G4HAG0_PLAVI|nr:conserved Plasmodium protein, unknown function [Plasmodium vivax]SCO71870.1 conserved Plasmodium protein, unknown function [Plasmodium vivax]VUZ94729.1 conserved Plasmodium protein, unknown function [Plasmodium vivax]
MQNAASSNLNMEKRFDHLKTFSSNIAGMVHELKDLIKIHEILIYKEKLSSTKKEQLQKHQDDLVALKMDLQSIKKENENMDGQLKYYKKIDESINYEIVNMSVNIQKMKLDINVQEKKKIEIKKDIDEMKNKCSKSLKQKHLLDHNLSQLAKHKQGSRADVSTNRANRLTGHAVKVGKENTKGVTDKSAKGRTTVPHRGLRDAPKSEANRLLKGLCI